MTDEAKALVERLRSQKDYKVVGFTPVTTVNPLCAEAADLIETQAREIEQLRVALQWMVDNDETNEGEEPMEEFGGQSWNEINAYWIDGLNRARAALAGDSHD